VAVFHESLNEGVRISEHGKQRFEFRGGGRKVVRQEVQGEDLFRSKLTPKVP